jgi:putative flippase GtrA
LVSFALVGGCCTAAYALLYLGLCELLPALAANALAQLATAVANTAGNRRFTFGVTGGRGALRHQLEGGVAFVVGLALSSAAIGLLHLLRPDASHGDELAALFAANALATVARFGLLRAWVFRPRRVGRA